MIIEPVRTLPRPKQIGNDAAASAEQIYDYGGLKDEEVAFDFSPKNTFPDPCGRDL